jgi:hypothetical protein
MQPKRPIFQRAGQTTLSSSSKGSIPIRQTKGGETDFLKSKKINNINILKFNLDSFLSGKSRF